jgi:nucleotide-binding universal stress UspA family protein
MMIGKMLCATDGSAHAAKAVAYAVEMAKRLGVALTFITVVSGEAQDKPLVWDEAAIRAGKLPPDKALLVAIKAGLEAGLQQLRAVRAPGDEIADTIVRYAETNSYHQIVTGSAGRTGAARLLIGSSAADLVTKAHCPVTVVR